MLVRLWWFLRKKYLMHALQLRFVEEADQLGLRIKQIEMISKENGIFFQYLCLRK